MAIENNFSTLAVTKDEGEPIRLFNQLQPHSTVCYEQGIIPELTTGQLKRKVVIIQEYGQTGSRKSDFASDLTKVLLEDPRPKQAAREQKLEWIICTDDIVDYTLIGRKMGLVWSKRGHLLSQEYDNIATISTDIREMAYQELPGKEGNPIVSIQEDVGVTAIVRTKGQKKSKLGVVRGDLLATQRWLNNTTDWVCIPILFDTDDELRTTIHNFRRLMRDAKDESEAKSILKRYGVKDARSINQIIRSVRVVDGDDAIKRQHELGVARIMYRTMDQHSEDLKQRWSNYKEFRNDREARLELMSNRYYPWWMEEMLLEGKTHRENPLGEVIPRGFIFKVDKIPGFIESHRKEAEERKTISLLTNSKVWEGNSYLRKRLQYFKLLPKDNELK